MSYCLNAVCVHPQNSDELKFCQTCGAKLWLGDRYRPIKPIGSGGFGRTFLAVDEYIPSHPRCVIKQLFPPKPGTRHASKATELFHREAERLDQLGQHTQIPKLLAHFTENNYQYLIQTYVEGQTLAQELAQTGVFNEAQIRQLLLDLLPLLQFIHDRRVIHRDIKPENIIRRRSDGQLVLVDFGASKFTTLSNISKTGTVIGSAGYAAPEQVGGKASFASDLYSLGVTCIHLLTDVAPFDLYSFTDGTWIWRSCLQAPVSDELAEILDRLIEPAMNRRYTSAVAALEDLQPKGGVAVSAAISTNNSGSLGKSPVMAKPDPWQCIRTLCGHDQSVAAIAISPNGHLFASASFDRTVKLWHLGTATLLGTLKGHTEPVVSLAFSPDGETVISGSVDDTIKLWNVKEGELIRSINDHSDSVMSLSVAITPDGQAIVSGSDDRTIRIWHLSTGKLLRTLRESRAITSLDISPDGRTLASGSGSNDVSLWNISTGELLHTLTGHTRDVNSVAFSSDGHLFASGSSDNTLRLWNFQTRKVRILSGHLDWVRTVQFSPDHELLASGSSDHAIKIWKLPDGNLSHTLIGHTREINAIAFTPNSQTLISGSSDRTIKIWRR